VVYEIVPPAPMCKQTFYPKGPRFPTGARPASGTALVRGATSDGRSIPVRWPQPFREHGESRGFHKRNITAAIIRGRAMGHGDPTCCQEPSLFLYALGSPRGAADGGQPALGHPRRSLFKRSGNIALPHSTQITSQMVADVDRGSAMKKRVHSHNRRRKKTVAQRKAAYA
jgi:hypothetical protein